MSDWTAEQLAAIKAAYAKGAAEIQLNGERIRFRSLAEMERIINRMESSVTNRTQPVARFAGYSRGDQ